MQINFPAFLDSLLILVQGWAGIFVVICIIWAVVAILNNVTGKVSPDAARRHSACGPHFFQYGQSWCRLRILANILCLPFISCYREVISPAAAL